MPALLPSARRTSRAVVLGATALSAVLPATTSGRRGQQALVLGALALGMPHGAADTELLRAAAHGDPRRHAGLLAGYAGLALAATAGVRRGGTGVERAVLVASAAHFGEGELACWADTPRRSTLLRAVAAVTTTLALPAAVGRAHRSTPDQVGATGAVSIARALGERRGGAVLLRPEGRRGVLPLTVLAGAVTAALAARGDRAAAADSALLTGLALLAPPSTAFAAYFGGWHAVRHTARVVDALVALGQLPEQSGLPAAGVELARRSAWAVATGLAGAAVLVLRDPRQASDAAFAAVLGLTVPHMATVALELSGHRPRRDV